MVLTHCCLAEWLRYVAATPMPMVNDFLMFYRPSTIEGGYPVHLQANEGALPLCFALSALPKSTLTPTPLVFVMQPIR